MEIGELTAPRDFFIQRARASGSKERQDMVDREAQDLSIRREYELLKVTWSSLNYAPAPTTAEELELMRRLDELRLRYPFYATVRAS
jgi:putative transposase